MRKGSGLDSALMTFTLVGQAMPTFWWGIVLITVFAVTFRLVPTSGSGSPEQLILPAMTLSTYVTALIVRLTRSAVIDVLGQDYIRTAKAKGLTPRRILFTHALKNASIPIVTVIGLQFGNLLGGSRHHRNSVCVAGYRAAGAERDKQPRLPAPAGDRPPLCRGVSLDQYIDRLSLCLSRPADTVPVT